MNNFKKKFLFIHLSVCIQEWVFDTTMIFCDSFCNRTLGVSPVFNYELEIHGIIILTDVWNMPSLENIVAYSNTGL